jgi:S1/P1 Nuclease
VRARTFVGRNGFNRIVANSEMKSARCRTLCFIFLTLQYSTAVQAYSPLGHEIVGAIADERLANTSTATKIRALLDGFTLEKAAVIADEIKGWDKKGVDDPRSFHYSAHRNIDRQLRDFWRANPPTPSVDPGAPSHHWFHYTDVPVVPSQRYRDGRAGRSQWDIVHMIPFCVQVLQGRVPEQNERKISKPVALILLAHYIGDIHQPLHVGAEYFDQRGRVVDPEKDKSALEDEGGNTFTLELSDDPPRRRGIHKKKLHGFWDYDAVNALFFQLPGASRKGELQALTEPHKRELVHEMATHEPTSWRMQPNVAVDGYAEIWADEILPIAREAYARLQFTDVHPQQEAQRIVAAGEAVEKTNSDQMNYRGWATGVVRQELHKAGWRLANLLEKIL